MAPLDHPNEPALIVNNNYYYCPHIKFKYSCSSCKQWLQSEILEPSSLISKFYCQQITKLISIAISVS